MMESPATLGELFDYVDADETQVRDHKVTQQSRDHLSQEIAEVVDVDWDSVDGELGGAIQEILDIGLADIFIGGWTKLKELQEYRDPEKHPPEETAIVPLHEHTVRSIHRPTVRIYSGEREIAKLEFQIEAALEVTTAKLKIRAGRIMEIIAGEYHMSGRITLAGQPLLAKVSRPYRLSGHISLGEGVEIPAI